MKMESAMLQILLLVLVTHVAATMKLRHSLGTRRYSDTPALNKHHNNIHGNKHVHGQSSVVDAWKKLQDINKSLPGTSKIHGNQVLLKFSQTSPGRINELSETRMLPVKYQHQFSANSRGNSAATLTSGHLRAPRGKLIQGQMIEQQEFKDVLAILLHNIFNDLYNLGSSASAFHHMANQMGAGKHYSRSYSRSGAFLRGAMSQELYKHVYRRAAVPGNHGHPTQDLNTVKPGSLTSSVPGSSGVKTDSVWKNEDIGHVLTIEESLMKVLAFILNPFGIGGAISHVTSKNPWPTAPNMLTWHRIINTHMRASNQN